MSSPRTMFRAVRVLPLLPVLSVFGIDRGDLSSVQVQVFEGVDRGKEFELADREPTATYTEPAFGFVRTPTKYTVNALPLDRSTPFVLRARYERTLAAGQYQFRLRSKGKAEFRIDGQLQLKTQAQRANGSGDDPVPPPVVRSDSPLRPAPYPHQDVVKTLELDAGPHRFTLLAVVGGKGLSPDTGELSVSFGPPGQLSRLLGPDDSEVLTDEEWLAYAAKARSRHRAADAESRKTISAPVVAAWEDRHRQVREWVRKHPAPEVPNVSSALAGFNDIDRFIGARLEAAGKTPRPLTDDLEFLRRLSLDVIGLIPSREDIRTYLADPPEVRRGRVMDRLLADARWADPWVSYWQDVLAENPGILKPDLNNTGPFRWWLHQSFAANLPFDRLVTELIEMEGSKFLGSPAGFGQATLNDAPMAAKGDIVAQAFLGRKLSCARCHDAPFHPYKQNDLFGIASLLEGKALELPKTATVTFVEGARRPLVEVTLKPGDRIDPHWPFDDLIETSGPISVPAYGTVPTRHRLAELIVSPTNERFAQVVVNRVWKRYLGMGLVEPAHDWNGAKPSHPDLLDYLAREFLVSGYDLKHIARLIFSSQTYQRQPVAVPPKSTRPKARLFDGPLRRRMSAEQLVDSLHDFVGKRFNCEELNLNPAGDRPPRQFLNLGRPKRAWEFTALSNERDRPALALPAAQSVVDVLTTFGWRQSRQDPITDRDDGASPLQTLVLANGIVGTRITRLSDDSAFTELCLEDLPLEKLIEEMYLRTLSRPPSADESRTLQALLGPTHADRKVAGARKKPSSLTESDRRVSWSNHLSAEATIIRMAEERQLRMGDKPTERLTPVFRERFEDALWALVNSPEFVMLP